MERQRSDEEWQEFRRKNGFDVRGLWPDRPVYSNGQSFDVADVFSLEIELLPDGSFDVIRRWVTRANGEKLELLISERLWSPI